MTDKHLCQKALALLFKAKWMVFEAQSKQTKDKKEIPVENANLGSAYRCIQRAEANLTNFNLK